MMLVALTGETALVSRRSGSANRFLSSSQLSPLVEAALSEVAHILQCSKHLHILLRVSGHFEQGLLLTYEDKTLLLSRGCCLDGNG